MTDINIAKQLRDGEQYTIVVVRNSQIIYDSKQIGVLPLYQACINELDFTGASVADKVIGKGAAMLLCRLGVKEIHTYIISQPAYDYLLANEIMVSYDSKVPFIKNRTGNGRCPVETMTDTIDDVDLLLIEIRSFLKSINLI